MDSGAWQWIFFYYVPLSFLSFMVGKCNFFITFGPDNKGHRDDGYTVLLYPY